MKDLRSTKKVLGVELVRNIKAKTFFFLSQESYIIKVLERFGMLKSKSV